MLLFSKSHIHLLLKGVQLICQLEVVISSEDAIFVELSLKSDCLLTKLQELCVVLAKDRVDFVFNVPQL